MSPLYFFQMVSRPDQFDVMVLPNLYGNIIANIGCGLVGGPGLVPGVNIGDNYAVFEMVSIGIIVTFSNILTHPLVLVNNSPGNDKRG